ncbi:MULTISPECIES: FAD binding domain-containing protein [Anaerotruncus]|uniref:FAD binding domain-containing protein n=2 Tax=Oscillospiraceae TaxID=216572 RepID=UPI00082A9AA9|nr:MULTISPECIES: FAD binding domain-containing protein [Anaerotruncus]RGX54760.1 hypothetical protein DWV16_12595 [Anaerotruncus sp. AF02-27]
MSIKIKGFLRAVTVTQALAYAAQYPGETVYLAGGTDVMVQAREDDRFAQKYLVDITGIRELTGISQTADTLQIGALATHAAVHESSLVQKYAELLSQAALTVGSPQIRNRGTIGGNIANASPAADDLSALAALGAKVLVKCVDGTEKLMTLTEVISRPYRNSLTNGELITSVIVPKYDGYRAYFYKLGRRNSLSISRMTIAACLKTDAQNRVEDLKLAVGSVFPQPVVFEEINRTLVGKIPSEAELSAFAKQVSDKIPEIAGIRPTTKYKQPVCQKLCERVLRELLGGEKIG